MANTQTIAGRSSPVSQHTIPFSVPSFQVYFVSKRFSIARTHTLFKLLIGSDLQMQFSWLRAIRSIRLPPEQSTALSFIWEEPKIDLSTPWWPKNYHTKFKLLGTHFSQCNFLFFRKELREIIIKGDSVISVHQVACSKQHFNDLSVNESQAYGLDFP